MHRIALCLLLVSCTTTPDPIFIPEPIQDDDPWSDLARTARADPGSLPAAIEAVRGDPAWDPAMDPWLDEIASSTHVHPLLVSHVVALAHRDTRSRFLVLYGDLTQMEIDRERDFLSSLEAAIAPRGYTLTVDEATTPDDWYAHLSARDYAAVLWRSEGWFEHKPDTPSHRITTRVWTTHHDATKTRIFSDDWARVLPEGLAFAAIASCGTAGPYLPDEVDILDHLGDPETLEFHTFHTDLLDRTLYLRTYRGLLATSGYEFDDLTWRAATEMLPDRTTPTLPASPTEADVWVRLVTDFSALTGHYRGIPPTGVDTEAYCWERWMRCTIAALGPWSTPTGDDDPTIRTSTPTCDDTGTHLTVTWDPATSTFDHDLADLLDTVTTEDVVATCTNVE